MKNSEIKKKGNRWIDKKRPRWPLIFGLSLLLHLGVSQIAFGDARIWDQGNPPLVPSGWTTDFTQGDPIDTGNVLNALNPQLAIDSGDFAYVTYTQSDGTDQRVYLSRYLDVGGTARPTSADDTSVSDFFSDLLSHSDKH